MGVVVSAGKGTSVGSKRSVSSKCNIKRKIRLMRQFTNRDWCTRRRVKCKSVKEWREGTHESRGRGSVREIVVDGI